MRKNSSFIEIVDGLVIRIGNLGSLLLLPLIAVIVFDVLSRKFQFIQQYILNSAMHDYLAPTKLQELEWHLHAAIFLLAFGMTYLANAHVRVDVYRERQSTKKQAWIETIGLILLAIPYLLVVIYYGYDFVFRSFTSNEGSDALTGLPNRWIIKSVLLLGLVLLFASVLSTLSKLFQFLLSDDPETVASAENALSIFPAKDEAAVQLLEPDLTVVDTIIESTESKS